MCYAIATKVPNLGLIRNVTIAMPIIVFSIKIKAPHLHTPSLKKKMSSS